MVCIVVVETLLNIDVSTEELSFFTLETLQLDRAIMVTPPTILPAIFNFSFFYSGNMVW